jgi:CheY-like chemotaxis protein
VRDADDGANHGVPVKKRILIVDDEPEFAELLARVMPEYELIVESDPRRVPEVVRFLEPDIILLDLVMPDGSGEALAQTLKRDPGLDGLPIIFVSGTLETRGDDEEPARLGEHPAFGKPFSLAALKRCIEAELAP